MSTLLLIVYFVALGLLSCLGLHRLTMAVVAWRGGREAAGPAAPLPEDLPTVLVQLPIYNEMLVVDRLLRRVAEMRYPSGRWRIQVLDDSTDETSRVVDRVVLELVQAGAPIEVVRRTSRDVDSAAA